MKLQETTNAARRFCLCSSEAVKVITTQEGYFPDFGHHQDHEMGGVWLHPIKLFDGFWLRFRDQGNIRIDLREHIRILAQNRRQDRALHPLIKIPISKGGSLKMAFLLPGGDPEIFHHMKTVFILKKLADMWNRHGLTGVKSLLPEASCPSVLQRMYGFYRCVWAFYCVLYHAGPSFPGISLLLISLL